MAETEGPDTTTEIPTVAVKSRRNISTVWIIPIIAILIGAWLAYDTISSKGPTISISFKTAEGLEAGKTKIKFKDVGVGTVETIEVKPDLSGVLVTVEMVKQAEAFLSDNTRFWVVRPRLTARGISGIGTLVSGAFIEIDPGEKGGKKLSFVGLENPPAVRTDTPGKRFILTASKLGSYTVGSPVLSKGIEVGEVLQTELSKDGKSIDVHIFVNQPHDKLVRRNTQFWDASGINISLDANGMQIKTEALMALLIGGIAFSTPAALGNVPESDAGARFKLFESRDAIQETSYTTKLQFIMFFENSVRGLSVGAPVEFRGIKVGSVVDVRLEFDVTSGDIRIPILVEIEPARISPIDGKIQQDGRNIDILIKRGLRARLKTGSFITGQLFIDLNLHPNAPLKMRRKDELFPEIPTIPSTIDELTSSVTQLIEKVQKLPLDRISQGLARTIEGADKLVNSPKLKSAISNLDTSITTMNRLIDRLDKLAARIDQKLVPQTTTALKDATATLKEFRNAISENSPLRYNLESSLAEFSRAARSIRELAEYLERNPSALISGKK